MDTRVETHSILANYLNAERLGRRIQDFKRDQRVTNNQLIEHYALKTRNLGSVGIPPEPLDPPPIPESIPDTMMLLVYLGLKLSHRLSEQAASRITRLCEILSEGT